MRFIDKAKYFKAIGYNPHPKQALFHASNARFRVAVCGRRFGKSHCAGRDAEPELLLPNKRIWIVGPSYDLGEKEFRVIWNDLIIKRGFGKDNKVKRAYNLRAGEMYIEFPHYYPNGGTRLEVRSAMHPEKLVGEALDGVIMSEAAKHGENTWSQYIRPALSDKRGWASFVTTPEGRNWIYDLWQLGQNQDAAYKDYESWRFPSWENSYVYPGGIDDPEIQLLKLTMGMEEFEQEIAASFNAVVNRIYGAFSEETHVKNVEFNPTWPNYIAFDYGFPSPLAAIEFQVSPSGTVYIWREYYKPNMILRQHLQELKTRPNPEGYHLDLCFGDAADPDATMNVNMEFAPCIALQESKQNWRQGVELVNQFLRLRESGETDEFGTPVLAPQLFVDFSCTNLIREFNTYKRRPTENNVVEHNVSGAAVKQDDHALDALRYGLMHLFVCGAQHHLSDVEDVNPTLAVARNAQPTAPVGEVRGADYIATQIELSSEKFFDDMELDEDAGYFSLMNMRF